MDYDTNNIFAKILRGELPAEQIYEDESCFAFMDIMPRVDGHALVIPKAPSVNFLDIAANDLQSLILVTQRIALAALATKDRTIFFSVRFKHFTIFHLTAMRPERYIIMARKYMKMRVKHHLPARRIVKLLNGNSVC